MDMEWRATDEGAVGVGPVPGHDAWQVTAAFERADDHLVLASLAFSAISGLPPNGLTGRVVKAVTVQQLLASLDTWRESEHVRLSFARDVLAPHGRPTIDAEGRPGRMVERSDLPYIVEVQLSPDASTAASGIFAEGDAVRVVVEGEETTLRPVAEPRRIGRPGRPADAYAYLAALYVDELNRTRPYGARARVGELIGRTSDDIGHQLDRAAELGLITRTGGGSGRDRRLTPEGRRLTGDGTLTRRQLLTRTRTRWKDPS